MDSNDQQRLDGWKSVFAGIGGPLDKRAQTSYGYWSRITDDELENMYLGDEIASLIVDGIPDDMTKEWLDFGPPEGDELSYDPASAEQLQDDLDRLGAQEIFKEALQWARLYGGSIVYVGMSGSGLPEEPLKINRISRVESLQAIDRRAIDLGASQFYDDPNDPNFGMPKLLAVDFPVGNEIIRMNVHHSKCLFFYGKPVPRGSRSMFLAEDKFWGLSVLQSVYGALRDFGGAMSSVVNLMYEMSVGKYKIPNLAQMLAQGQEQKIIQRMEIINMSKSIINAVLLGEGEEYTRETLALSGAGDVLDRIMARISGPSGYPQTKLFGRSPAGMNATGESDTDTYYDKVRSQQENQMRFPLSELVKILGKVGGYQPSHIRFRPLKTLSQKEEAEIAQQRAVALLQRAQAYQAHFDLGTLTAEQIYRLEWEDDLGPMPEPGELGGETTEE